MHIIINRLKNRIIELKQNNTHEDTIRVILKEILQDYVLAGIYLNEDFRELIFIGGTALRKLYSLNRFSEDLDFSSSGSVDLYKLGNYLILYFKQLEFTTVDFTIQKSAAVNRLTLKFPILKEIGLSNLESEKIHIKVEITTGKIFTNELFTKNLMNTPLVISSYPLSTLMSGKILACLERTFVIGNIGVKIKGRDYYDLIWYMERGVIPNQEVLLAANPINSIVYVFNMLDKKILKISSEDLLLDLKTFFENYQAIKIWCDNFQSLYQKYRKAYS
ncbi:MAG: nucleotidyl transferase AbiEii/AbiGii toxin family protein [bacterium]